MTTKTRVAAAPTAARRNRITGTGEEAPDQLLANPANWRIHPKAQQDALAGPSTRWAGSSRSSANPNIRSPRAVPSRLVRPFDSSSSISEMYLLA